MKSKSVQRLLKLLLAVLGAGAGAAVALGLVQLYRWTHAAQTLPIWLVATLYLGLAGLGALVFFLLSGRIIHKGGEWAAVIEKYLDGLTMAQLCASMAGLICGMLIAALASQVVGLMGAPIFTTAFSAILFVFLGAVGLSIGYKRGEDLTQLWGRIPSWKERRSGKRAAGQARPKLLDTSIIIDGRILDVCRVGFLEGEIIVPDFVLDELRHIADSSDASRRARGRRGLDILQKLQEMQGLSVRVEHTGEDAAEADVRLLRLARQLGAAIVTGDYNLNRVVSVSGVAVLNLNELAGALRPVALPGEEMRVAILREGKESGQGVGYLDDGTMIVVEGGQPYQGKTVDTVITSALQTSAGRMIFARVKGLRPFSPPTSTDV